MYNSHVHQYLFLEFIKSLIFQINHSISKRQGYHGNNFILRISAIVLGILVERVTFAMFFYLSF